MSEHRPSKQALYVGGFLILIGVLFLLQNARIIRLDFLFENFWPLLLIAIGALIIYQSSKRRNSTESHTTFGDRSEYVTDDYISASHTFGDLSVSLDSQKFKGGRLQTTFGELHANLAKVNLDDGQNILNLNVTFGDIEVSVPKDLPVRISASNLAGDIKLFDQKWDGLNKRASWQSSDYETANAKLDIVCNIVFGDIKVW
jgi:lia operon protein LiaF